MSFRREKIFEVRKKESPREKGRGPLLLTDGSGSVGSKGDLSIHKRKGKVRRCSPARKEKGKGGFSFRSRKSERGDPAKKGKKGLARQEERNS